MTTDQKSLWIRIEGFSMDEPEAALSFSQRLARENRWSREHAQRAIREYKRFMFLGCAAGHPVSPSEDVDQVWHLHLVYTKSYWKDFCGEVLKRPFHHSPTKGGKDESAKFEDWYANTLESYRKFFGEEPPADIWPARPVHHELTWIDTRSNWIVPKPGVARLLSIVGMAAMLAVAGCASLTDVNIFNYSGPEFLTFFFWFSVLTFVGAGLWRRAMINRIRPNTKQVDQPNAYSIAYLAGGPVLCTNSAIVGLIDRKLVAFAPGSGELEATAVLPGLANLHPLESAILNRCATGSPSVKQVRESAEAELEGIRANLEQQGLVIERSRSNRIRNLALAAAALVPAIGCVKIAVGVSRDKPVGFLVFGVFLSLVVIVVGFRRRPFRTQAATNALSRLRSDNFRLRHPEPAEAISTVSALPLAVALFGLSALQRTPYAFMEPNLTPAKRHPGEFGHGSDSGCSSSCGSSASCGSGTSSTSSSCGGGGSSCGGGGGSGCGGCGGGSS
jgi:uncharacterized protein (TIGR04222 family)